MYWKVSFGTQRLAVYSEFGGCALFGSRKCTASTGIAVGTSTVVGYSEEVRYWEGPLSEVPLYVINKKVKDHADADFQNDYLYGLSK